MKKRSILSLLALLLLSMVSVAFMSCGGNDDSPAGENGNEGNSTTVLSKQIVGSWSTNSSDTHSDGTQDGWIFNADGTGIMAEHYDRGAGEADVITFTYTVNDNSRAVSITYQDGDRETWTNVVVANGVLSFTEDGKTTTLVKKSFMSYVGNDDSPADENGNEDNPTTVLSKQIVGSWSTHRFDTHSDGTQDGWIFNADGTGIMAEHYDRGAGEADVITFTYTVNDNSRAVSITYQDGDRETWTNVVVANGVLSFTEDGKTTTLVKKSFSYK